MYQFHTILFHLLLLSLMLTEGSFERANYGTIFVKNGMPWGTWSKAEMCGSGTYASGFSLRVEGHQGSGDDTALNGIALHCPIATTLFNTASFYTTVRSDTGSYGAWTKNKWCTKGFLVAFQFRVESGQGDGDDTAANNIRFKCSDGTILEGDGMSWGTWGDWSSVCKGKGICGIQTRVEQPQGSGDDTALNDVKFYCC